MPNKKDIKSVTIAGYPKLYRKVGKKGSRVFWDVHFPGKDRGWRKLEVIGFNNEDEMYQFADCLKFVASLNTKKFHGK